MGKFNIPESAKAESPLFEPVEGRAILAKPALSEEQTNHFRSLKERAFWKANEENIAKLRRHRRKMRRKIG